MGLLVAGLIEACVGVGLGLFLLVAEPAINSLWGMGLVALGILTAVLSIFWGRSRSNRPEEIPPDDNEGDETVSSLSPADIDGPSAPHAVYSLPESRPSSSHELVPVMPHLPERVSYLREQLSRLGWSYKAKDIHARAAEVADIVMKNHGSNESNGRDERPRQLRRLLELFILSQGYDAWANGQDPVFNMDRYRKFLSKNEIVERLVDLNAEEDLLWEEIRHSGPVKEPDDAYRQTIGVRIRLERISAAEERLEEIEILRLGYRSLLDQWDDENAETTEGR